MTSIISLIGSASGWATLIDFLIPDSTAAERGNCLVTVQLGLDGTSGDDGDLEGAGGYYPSITLFNNNEDPIGTTMDADILMTEITSGAFATLETGTGSGQQAIGFALQPIYGDQICVASVTVTWPDQQRRAWIGDNGAACDSAWYPSGIIVDDNNYETRCTWANPEVEGGDEFENLAGGFEVDFRAFNGRDSSVPEEADALSNEDFWDEWCRNPPAQQFWNNLFEHPWDRRRSSSSLGPWGTKAYRSPLPSASGPKPRSSGFKLKGRSTKENRLVVSNSDQFSAKALCENERSWGPDFVSLKDGFFCDMATKTAKPLCTEDVDEDCFQLSDVSGGGKHKRAVGSRSNYAKIVEQNPKNQTMEY